MPVKIADTIKPMGDFPALEAMDLHVKKTDGSYRDLQTMYENGELGGLAKISTKEGNELINVTDTGEEGVYYKSPFTSIKLNGTKIEPDANNDIDIKLSQEEDNLLETKDDGLYVAPSPVDNDDKDMTYDKLFDAEAEELDPYHGDATKEVSSEYLYNQIAIVIPIVVDKIKNLFDLASSIEYQTYDTYADLELVDQTVITDRVMIYLVKQDENYPRLDGAADYYSTIYLMIPKSDPTTNAVEYVAKLNMSEKMLEFAIIEAIKRSLYLNLPAHYEKSASGVEGALEVVADGSGAADGQIELSNVTPVYPADLVIVAGDYVLHYEDNHSGITKFIKRDELDEIGLTWTGTQSEYAALDKSTLKDKQTVIITDDSIGDSGSSNKYSNEEIVVGTWFGKNSYRKSFVLEGANRTTNSEYTDTFPHGIENIKDVINLYGVSNHVNMSNTPTSIPLGMTTSTSNMLCAWTDNTYIYVRSNGLSFKSPRFFVTVIYTKSTD